MIPNLTTQLEHKENKYQKVWRMNLGPAHAKTKEEEKNRDKRAGKVEL